VNSDHCPLLIDTNPSDTFSPRPFRFEEVWANNPRSYAIIDKAWQKEVVSSPCFKLFRKQQHTTAALKRWNKITFGFCLSKISELNARLEQVQLEPLYEANVNLEKPS
jgi:hypothetical protein